MEADYPLERSEGLSFEEFVESDTLRRALVRSLEIMGEASKKVPGEFRAQYPTLDWRAMGGMAETARRSNWRWSMPKPAPPSPPCGGWASVVHCTT